MATCFEKKAPHWCRGGKLTTEFSVPPADAPFNPLNKLDASTVEIVALGGQSYYLNKLWASYLAQPEGSPARTPQLLDAFVRSAFLCARGCCSLLHPLVKQAVQLPEADPTVLSRLALVVGDVGYADCGRLLFDRCKGTKMPVQYYHSLLKLAADSARAVDMDFAFEIADEMQLQGRPHTGISLRLLLEGIGRLPTFPLEMVKRIANYRMDNAVGGKAGSIEMCFIYKLFGLLESVSGSQVPDTVAYLQELLDRDKTIMSYFLCEFSPYIRSPMDGAECEECKDKKLDLYLGDPFSLKIPDQYDPTVPEGKRLVPILKETDFVVFLYSSVRTLSSLLVSLGADHPLQKKRQYVIDLLKANPKQSLIIPLKEELCVRLPEEAAPVTVHDKMYSFLAGIAQAPCPNTTLSVVTADPAVAQRVQRIIPATTEQFPFTHFASAAGGRSERSPVISDEQVG